MLKRAREICRLQTLEQRGHALVHGRQKGQRYFDGGELTVGQFRPRLLIVGFDRRILLCRRKLETDEAVDVRVGEMMHNLTDGPAAFTVRRVELRRRQARERYAHLARNFGDALNFNAALGGVRTESQPTPEMLKMWEQMQEFIKRATPPGVIAEAVFEEGIRKGKLYIIPHKETAQYIRNRFDGIMKDI